MKKERQINKLKFEPRNEIIAARFTKSEATAIKDFCIKNGIPQSRIIRQAFEQLVPNLKK